MAISGVIFESKGREFYVGQTKSAWYVNFSNVPNGDENKFAYITDWMPSIFFQAL